LVEMELSWNISFGTKPSYNRHRKSPVKQGT
jgi:hypothetical protein